MRRKKSITIFGTRSRTKSSRRKKKSSKNGTDEEKAPSYAALEHLLLEFMKLLHPFMPFVTEEVYRTFRPGKMLMVERW